jgi:hypothetical protein
MSASSPSEETGLAKRGLLLLGFMVALAAVVLFILLKGPTTPTRTEQRLERPVVPLIQAAAPFPGSLPWATFVQLAEQAPSAPGWEIRYNAALALARRGSPHTPWHIVHEMLDIEQQRRNFRVELRSGKIVADEEAALRTVYNTLGAIADWHKKTTTDRMGQLPEGLARVYEDVDRLTQSSYAELRVQADRVRQTFFRN